MNDFKVTSEVIKLDEYDEERLVNELQKSLIRIYSETKDKIKKNDKDDKDEKEQSYFIDKKGDEN